MASYNILQKASMSCCIKKSNFLVDKMMNARRKKRFKETLPIVGKSGRELAVSHIKLTDQEKEFYDLSIVSQLGILNCELL